MRIKLLETFEARTVVDPSVSISVENFASEWNGLPYAALSVCLVWLRHLAMVHQTHHWISRGSTSYGDHLLFSRLYDAIAEEIDTVAEKCVGVSSEAAVHVSLQASQLDRMIREYSSLTVSHQDDMVRKSLELEFNFLKVLQTVSQMLSEEGKLTYGVDNMLAGIADSHEKNVYLLKQRAAQG